MNIITRLLDENEKRKRKRIALRETERACWWRDRTATANDNNKTMCEAKCVRKFMHLIVPQRTNLHICIYIWCAFLFSLQFCCHFVVVSLNMCGVTLEYVLSRERKHTLRTRIVIEFTKWKWKTFTAFDLTFGNNVNAHSSRVQR